MITSSALGGQVWGRALPADDADGGPNARLAVLTLSEQVWVYSDRCMSCACVRVGVDEQPKKVLLSGRTSQTYGWRSIPY